jgi:epoxyqueuosine reductase
MTTPLKPFLESVRAASRRFHHRFVHRMASTSLIDWLLRPSYHHWYGLLPPLPRFVTARLGTEPPLGARSLQIPELPEQLRTTPGIPRDPMAEESAFADGPLQQWSTLHDDALEFIFHHSWPNRLMSMPSTARLHRQLAGSNSGEPSTGGAKPEPAALTQQLKAMGASLGLSAVGVAAYDPKYTFAPYLNDNDGDRVVVCILEQNWAATQTLPSLRSERAHNNTYARLVERATALADFLRGLGYGARTGSPDGSGMYLHYAVQAGLGQMGLNGQVLTPFAGSRCRIVTITTDAPLLLDVPVDYGVPALCDACKACVRRCPSGAISSKRAMHRGVYKAKIKTERCLPVVAQVSGCAICMKVCPVQRYGLPAVVAEFKATGRVLGSQTDELEGYTWPMDGRHYGPGEKPKSGVSKELLDPPGLNYDSKRKLPLRKADGPSHVDFA